MLTALYLLVSLASLVCYIMVVVKMFQHGKTGPGLFSTLGLFLCLLGYPFAFIYGWMKAGEWRIQNIMIVWTVCFLANLGLGIATYPQQMEAFRIQQEQLLQQNKVQPVAPVVPAPAPAPVPAPANP